MAHYFRYAAAVSTYLGYVVESRAGRHTHFMPSLRSEYSSDARWLENEIAELTTFSELARQRATQAVGDEKHRQLTDIAVKLRVRAERLANILEMLKAEKRRP
jgi:hypothetical protein